MRAVAPGFAEQPSDLGLLGAALVDSVRRTGASAGVLYLLDRPAQALNLAVLCGLPEEVAWPWHRIPLATATPVSEAVRGDRFVWVGSQEQMALTYPRVAVSLPYRFALAAAPLSGRTRCWGGLVLLWPASHPDRVTRRESGHIAAEARGIAHRLDQSPEQPRQPLQPLRVPLTPPSPYVSGAGSAAADFAERLPEGALALDLEGRVTFVNGVAATLLGRSVSQLLGTRPWQSLPWLDRPIVEDHYRTAVISREPVEFTALHPPDRPLCFQLYPDVSGISVRITNASGGPSPVPDSTRRRIPRLVSAASPTAHTGRLYQLLHLASALTETVAVSDVVELVAGQVLPAFGADGLVLSAADAGRLKITGWHGYDRETIE